MIRSNLANKILFYGAPILLVCLRASARGGGAGGGHSSGSGGGSYGGGGDGGGFLIGLLFQLIFSSGPIGWIIIIALIYLFFRYQKSSVSRSTQTLSPSYQPAEVATSEVLQGESLANFKDKVNLAFLSVQEAWSEKRLELMRRFISDGVYQRFHAQFTMMNLLRESNPITDVVVDDIEVVNAWSEPGYDCIDVAISASADDQFISERFPQLNSPGGNESFVEYWSFVRRHDFKRGTDIFHSELCPKCSAPLTSKLVETAQCPYCGTYLNSGEYDWVLSEITQAEDYGYQFSQMEPTTSLHDESLQAKFDFSRHVLEDRASNAFLQILIAQLMQNTDVLKRFCTPQAFEFFQKSTPQVHVAYNRLYTQAVQVIKTKVSETELRAYVAIKFAYSIVFLDSGRSGSQSEEQLNSDIKIIELYRVKSDHVAKASVIANSCPSCGAAQKDNLSAICSYCQAPLNDPKLDWIVADLFDLDQISKV